MQFNLHSIVAFFFCSALLTLTTPSRTLTRTVVEKVATTEALTVGVLFDTIPDSDSDADSHLVRLDLIEAQAEENSGARFTWERNRDGADVIELLEPKATLVPVTANGKPLSSSSIKLSGVFQGKSMDKLLAIAGTVAAVLIVAAVAIAILLPKILKAMGLHPDYDAGQKYDLP
jgi:hypothetical protein